MTNAEKFKEIFGLYATEVWSMPEQNFLEWLNANDCEGQQYDGNLVNDGRDKKEGVKNDR